MPVLAETTIQQPISQFLYSGSADYVYFIGPTNWGGTCNAYYVQILASQQGKDKLFATALAAFTAGKNVLFYGGCDASGYFDANYIVVVG